MSRSGAAVITVVVALASGCTAPPAPPLLPPTSAAPPLSSMAVTTPNAAQPAKLTAACPLLPAEEVTRILGSAKGTRLTATEDKDGGVDAGYTCAYRNGQTTVLALSARTLSEGRTPDTAIDSIARNSKTTTRPVTDVGDKAVFYVNENDVAVLAVAKRSGPMVRTVILSAPKVVPERKLAEVAKAVLPRL